MGYGGKSSETPYCRDQLAPIAGCSMAIPTDAASDIANLHRCGHAACEIRAILAERDVVRDLHEVIDLGRRIIVESIVARSMVTFAPISTSSSMITLPICGIFSPFRAVLRSRSRRCRCLAYGVNADTVADTGCRDRS